MTDIERMTDIESYIYYFLSTKGLGALEIENNLSEEESKKFKDLEDSHSESLSFYVLWERFMKNMKKHIPKNISICLKKRDCIPVPHENINQKAKENISLLIKQILASYLCIFDEEPEQELISELISELNELSVKFETEALQVFISFLEPCFMVRSNAQNSICFDDYDAKNEEIMSEFESSWMRAMNKFIFRFSYKIYKYIPLYAESGNEDS